MNRLTNMLIVFIFLLAGLLLGGCVHEWPETPFPEDATLLLEFEHDRPLPLFTTVDYVTKSRRDAPGYQIRYTVNAYAAGSRRLVSSHRFLKDDLSTMDHIVELTLPRGRYSIKVWAEYISGSGEDDLFYNLSDFSEIKLTGDRHHGCSDFRDAALGSFEADLTLPAGTEEWEEVRVSGKVRLERPLARYRFITTDIKEFLARYEKGTTAYGDRSPAKSPAEIISEYYVKFRYAGFMPSSFNVFTDAPADASTGVSFDGQMRVIDPENIELGFDYVFVNHSETTVDVTVELYSRLTRNLVAASGPVKVPLLRSHLTEVRGHFLTSTSTGGMGINPDFSGSFDIEIK